jgi:hypothetical protein
MHRLCCVDNMASDWWQATQTQHDPYAIPYYTIPCHVLLTWMRRSEWQMGEGVNTKRCERRPSSCVENVLAATQNSSSMALHGLLLDLCSLAVLSRCAACVAGLIGAKHSYFFTAHKTTHSRPVPPCTVIDLDAATTKTVHNTQYTLKDARIHHFSHPERAQ